MTVGSVVQGTGGREPGEFEVALKIILVKTSIFYLFYFLRGCILTVCLCRWHICEQQEAKVLRNGKSQAQAAEWTFRDSGGKAGLVKSEVGKGHQKPRCRVQSNAEPPYETLWTQAYWGTDRRQVIRNLKDITMFKILLSTQMHTYFLLLKKEQVSGTTGNWPKKQ